MSSNSSYTGFKRLEELGNVASVELGREVMVVITLDLAEGVYSVTMSAEDVRIASASGENLTRVLNVLEDAVGLLIKSTQNAVEMGAATLQIRDLLIE